MAAYRQRRPVRSKLRRKPASRARTVRSAARGRPAPRKRVKRTTGGRPARAAAQQVVKLVLEQLAPSAVSRPELALAKEGVIATRKGKAAF